MSTMLYYSSYNIYIQSNYLTCTTTTAISCKPMCFHLGLVVLAVYQAINLFIASFL